MGMFDALEISASGLTAERLRMDVTAENLANAQTTRGADGQPYRRKEVVLAEREGQSSFGATLAGAMGRGGRAGGVEVAAIAQDATPLKQVYDPGHPDAEAAKLAANALEHQAAVQVAATRNAILRSAMGVA